MSRLVVDNIENLAGDERFGPVSMGVVDATNGGADDLTEIDFTGIPDWVKRITIVFEGVSSSGTDNYNVQLGDSGGIESTGYLGSFTSISASSVATANATTAFKINNASGVNIVHGALTLTLVDPATNTWACSGVLARSNAAFTLPTAGSKTLSSTLDRIRITTDSGTDTFDAGNINVIYE